MRVRRRGRSAAVWLEFFPCGQDIAGERISRPGELACDALTMAVATRGGRAGRLCAPAPASLRLAQARAAASSEMEVTGFCLRHSPSEAFRTPCWCTDSSVGIEDHPGAPQHLPLAAGVHGHLHGARGCGRCRRAHAVAQQPARAEVQHAGHSVKSLTTFVRVRGG